MTSMVTQIALIVWAAALAYEDWRRRRLPNMLLLAGFAMGLMHWLAYGAMPSGVTPGEGAAAAVLGLAALIPLYAAGWMGAGDVKLCGVIGWLGGVKLMLTTFVMGSIVAGGLALLLCLPLGKHWLVGAGTHERLRGRVPFGSSLAFALVATTIGWLDPAWLHLG